MIAALLNGMNTKEQNAFDAHPWTSEDEKEITIGEITFIPKSLHKANAKCPVCRARMLRTSHPVYKICPNGHF